MSKSNTFENDFLKLIFNGTTITGLANNAASPVSFYVSLHTASPGEAGDQTTNETTYGSYARVAVARTTGGWTVTNNSVSPVASITFPTCTSGTATITHLGIGTDSSGAGVLVFYGALSSSLDVATGSIPRLTTATTITED